MLLMNSELTRTSAFYYTNHYDPEIPHLDNASAGSQPVGEGFTFDPVVRPAFRGKVLIVTGIKDPAICGFMAVEMCGYNESRVRGVEGVFGSNSGFDFYMPVAGHDVNWHFGA